MNFNKTAQTLRAILDIPIEAGICYDNSAQFIKAMKVRLKPLQLPSRVQFHELIKFVRTVNNRFSNDAADLIEFWAYGGFRKSEAQSIPNDSGVERDGGRFVRQPVCGVS